MDKLCWTTPLTVVDSHTGGEPTRVILDGGPDLSRLTPALARDKLASDYDAFRQAVINEPRGNEVLVGALKLPPTTDEALCGVVFFNNVGYLGMCGHGLIGLMVTLHQQGQIGLGTYKIETPVGTVSATLVSPNQVQITNVPSYRLRQNVTVTTQQHGPVTGDIAWGGNWFFLISDHGQELNLANWRSLTNYCLDVQKSLQSNGIFGLDNAIIDHVELFAPSNTGADSQNFVLCPGNAYDRSPCGTGCSAKVACLAADKKLDAGQNWIQESITGSRFQLQYSLAESTPGYSTPDNLPADCGPVVVPQVSGSAFVHAQSQLFFASEDPFRMGITP